MKRMLPLLLAAGLCFALVACGGGETPTAEPIAPEEIPVNTLYNTESGVMLTLGMTKTEVDALLGEGTEFVRETPAPYTDEDGVEHNFVDSAILYPNLDMFYGSGKDLLMVTFDKDELLVGAGSSVYYENADKSVSNWCVTHGIAIGSDRADLFANYGEKEATFPGAFDTVEDLDPPVAAEDYYGYEYFFDTDGRITDNYDETVTILSVFLDNSNGKLFTLGIHSAGETFYEAE